MKAILKYPGGAVHIEFKMILPNLYSIMRGIIRKTQYQKLAGEANKASPALL